MPPTTPRCRPGRRRARRRGCRPTASMALSVAASYLRVTVKSAVVPSLFSCAGRRRHAVDRPELLHVRVEERRVDRLAVGAGEIDVGRFGGTRRVRLLHLVLDDHRLLGLRAWSRPPGRTWPCSRTCPSASATMTQRRRARRRAPGGSARRGRGRRSGRSRARVARTSTARTRRGRMREQTAGNSVRPAIRVTVTAIARAGPICLRKPSVDRTSARKAMMTAPAARRWPRRPGRPR